MVEAESYAKGGGLDGDTGKEIQEPYDSDEEKEWKEQHKESVRKLKVEEKTIVTENDEELWKRLDELEVQEELDAYLEKEKERNENTSEDEADISDAGSKDWSESPGLTDDEDEIDEMSAENSENNILQQRPVIKEDKVIDISESNSLIETANSAQKSEQDIIYLKENETIDNSKLSPNTKKPDKSAVQPRTRRVSFGSISEYEYQRDGDFKSGKQEVLTRHSWSEHSSLSTPGLKQHPIPEHDTSVTQSKSISMEALAESLAQINAGKHLSFGEKISKTSQSTSEAVRPVGQNSQSKAKISISPSIESIESESPQKTPTVFFTHFEEEEDEIILRKERTDENRVVSYTTDVSAESGDHDFVYDSVPKNPADILRLYGFRRSSIDRPRLKGILKPSGSSHSLADDSSLADDTSISDTSIARSPASVSSASGRFKISPTKISDNVINTLLSSSPINSTSSLRSNPGGSRFSISPTKISDPSIFTPPDKNSAQMHHLTVDSGSPSRFCVKRIDEQTFVPPEAITKKDGVEKEKENVPLNAIVMEKNISRLEEWDETKNREDTRESSDGAKEEHLVGKETQSAKKESRFKASRGLKRAKEDNT